MRTTISVNRVTSSQPGSAVATRYATLLLQLQYSHALRCGEAMLTWTAPEPLAPGASVPDCPRPRSTGPGAGGHSGRARPGVDDRPDMLAPQRRGQPARNETVHDLHALDVAGGGHDF
jgi:hypothetical protein